MKIDQFHDSSQFFYYEEIEKGEKGEFVIEITKEGFLKERKMVK